MKSHRVAVGSPRDVQRRTSTPSFPGKLLDVLLMLRFQRGVVLPGDSYVVPLWLMTCSLIGDCSRLTKKELHRSTGREYSSNWRDSSGEVSSA